MKGVHILINNRFIKHDIVSKGKNAKMKLLPSVFSCLYNRVKKFVFGVKSGRHLSIFVWIKDYKNRKKHQK